jgi:type II secretory pathway pseudopilin PulG
MRALPLHRHGKAKQHGAALMIMIAILVVAIVAGLVGALSLSALNSARQEKTSAALAQARDALLGRAASDDNMPGSLPCPDTNDDGSSELLSGNDCPSYVGRLPWRTLNLPDLRDGSGERLWYALSPAFRDDNSAQPLNSNTKGSLPVYNADGATLQTQAGYDAVAVIFSPGSPVGSQVRNTVAQQTSAANYLDTANGRNNASVGGPFIAGAKSDTFNDQLLYITTKNLMPLVERRVAGVVKQALSDYYAAHTYYPWADNIISASDYNSNYGLNRGWLPDNASSNSGSWHPDPPDWQPGSPPQWFFDNQWYALIYYSVAKSYTSYPGDCYSCVSNTTLFVDTVNQARILFFMPGTPIGALTRAIDTLSDYLEDAENTNNDDVYATPSSQAMDRDRLYWLSSSQVWNQ